MLGLSERRKELEELLSRINSLSIFIGSIDFEEKLNTEEKDLLLAQLQAMSKYALMLQKSMNKQIEKISEPATEIKLNIDTSDFNKYKNRCIGVYKE